MADKVFQFQEFSWLKQHTKQKNNGDCYDTTRGCCSRGAATEKVGIKGYLAFFLTIIFFPVFFPEQTAGGAFLIFPF